MRPGKMSDMALVVVCLVASAAILWIILPAGGDGVAASAVGGELQRSGLHVERTADIADDRSPASPNGTANAAAGGGAEARVKHSETVDGLIRSLAKNWADGTITDAEYIRAVSYLYENGHVTGGGSPRTHAEPEPVAEGGARGVWPGPAGSKQMWCKPGLAVAMDIHTGDLACLPVADANRLADGGGENSPGAAGDANAGDRVAELEREVAKLEQIGAEMRRTIEYLYGEVVSYRDAAGKSGTDMAARQAASDVPSQACLHGTSAFFASLLDPQVLAETSGALGATMMPGGEYTVLLAAAATSRPVTMSIDLEGEKGMSYAGRFALDDTEWPPGEDATLWDYNSGRAEFAVPVQQAVNMTVGVEGDMGGRAYMALAMCR